MEKNKFSILKSNIQEIIDLIAKKEINDANFKFTETSELLDEILDNSEADEDLIELSKYQVLLNQLYIKTNNLNKINK